MNRKWTEKIFKKMPQKPLPRINTNNRTCFDVQSDLKLPVIGLYYAPHYPVELRQFVGSYQSPRILEKSSQDGLQILTRSSWQDGLNYPSKFQRHVLMSYDVFLVTRKVTQNNDMRQKWRENGRYAPKVPQNGTPRAKVTCIVSRSPTQIFDKQLKHGASDWLVTSGPSRAIWSSFVIIHCITFWICQKKLFTNCATLWDTSGA